MLPEVPAVPGILTADQVRRTAQAIGMVQLDSGAIPWYPGGHVDPWDHVESAMGLAAAGQRARATRAYRWLRATQRPDGSWPLRVRAGRVEDAAADTNFCAYPAVGVWHHVLLTGDAAFAAEMWPMVRAAVEFVLGAQRVHGQISWAVDPRGEPFDEALLSGCSSIHHSLRCALALAEHVGSPQPHWQEAADRLGAAVRAEPAVFAPKSRYSMDWYYPVLGGAVRDTAAVRLLRSRWDEFVVDGLGVRCVVDRPWVTGAETCELVLSLDALGENAWAHKLFAAMQHLRDPDGSYWTGYVFADGKRWPWERTTWTSAAVILAADALARTTPANGVFRGVIGTARAARAPAAAAVG